MKTVPVQSVKRALDLLDMLLFADESGNGLPLQELARRMEMRPNSVHNLLKTMNACGYVAQNESGRYITGPRCDEIARRNALLAPELHERVLTELNAIASKTGEAAVFAILLDGKRVPVQDIASPNAIGINRTMLIAAGDIYSLPTGRILIAFASERERTRIIEQNGFPKERWENIQSEKELHAAASALKEKGFCMLDETAKGVISLAVPVLRPDGSLLGTLGSYAPAYRCTAEQQSAMQQALHTASERLTTLA